MRMRKLVLNLSVAEILPEKINKMLLPKKLGFIDVLSTVLVQLKHCKNVSDQSKIIPVLKLPRFFPRRDEKERQISSQETVLTDLSRSYVF